MQIARHVSEPHAARRGAANPIIISSSFFVTIASTAFIPTQINTRRPIEQTSGATAEKVVESTHSSYRQSTARDVRSFVRSFVRPGAL